MDHSIVTVGWAGWPPQAADLVDITKTLLHRDKAWNLITPPQRIPSTQSILNTNLHFTSRHSPTKYQKFKEFTTAGFFRKK